MTLPPADIIDRFVGMRLREERHKQEITMADLGAAIGASYPQIQKYENASIRMRASTLYQLAQVLNISPLAFYDGLDTDTLTSRDKADPAVARRQIAQIVAGLDLTTLNLVMDFLANLKAPDPDPTLASRKLALAAARDPVPLVAKRRRARFRSRVQE